MYINIVYKLNINKIMHYHIYIYIYINKLINVIIYNYWEPKGNC